MTIAAGFGLRLDEVGVGMMGHLIGAAAEDEPRKCRRQFTLAGAQGPGDQVRMRQSSMRMSGLEAFKCRLMRKGHDRSLEFLTDGG